MFKQAKDGRLISGAATALASDATGAKVTLINFDFTCGTRRFTFTGLGNTGTDFEKYDVHGFSRQAGQSGRIRSTLILGKAPRQMMKLLFRNMGTAIILILPCHSSSFALVMSA